MPNEKLFLTKLANTLSEGKNNYKLFVNGGKIQPTKFKNSIYQSFDNYYPDNIDNDK